jgi:F-type H+-transporting ATPase subunit a
MASFAPDVITYIGSFPFTNTFLNTLIIDGVIIGSAVYLKNNITKIPRTFQNIVEFVIETYYNFTEQIAGKNVVQIFPWVMTFFLIILITNWSGLLPGNGSIGYLENDHGDLHVAVPFFRNATSDANMTFALAFISLIVTHTLAIRTTGIKDYFTRFFSLNPILLFVGVLEIVSEITKLVSLSFRLFGNIFAGEVVLHTVSDIFAFVFPVPFMLLEVIVGLVQALVFSILTLVFMSILMTPHHQEEH